MMRRHFACIPGMMEMAEQYWWPPGWRAEQPASLAAAPLVPALVPHLLTFSHGLSTEAGQATAGRSPSPSYLSVQGVAKQTGNSQCQGEAVQNWKASQRKRTLQLSAVLLTQSPLFHQKDLL